MQVSIGERLWQAIPTLLIVSCLTFFLLRALPGDPIDIMLGNAQKDLAPQALDQVKKDLGLDRSAPEQYFLWLASWIQPQSDNAGLGFSYKDGRPVKQVILERLPLTVGLVALSLIGAFTLGILLGLLPPLLTAMRLGLLAESIQGALTFLYASQNFWLAFLYIWYCANTGLATPLPLIGDLADWQMAPLVVPALLLGIRRAAKIALFIGSQMKDEMLKPYYVQAMAKGLSPAQILTRHVLKNCMLPIIQIAGLSLPALIGGSVLIETIFALPGMGRLLIESVFGRNYPVVISLTVLYTSMVIVSNLAADIVNTAADPRLRA